MTRFIVSNWHGRNEIGINGVFDHMLEIDESGLWLKNKQTHALIHLPVSKVEVEVEKE